jgi:hypothetical protein
MNPTMVAVRGILKSTSHSYFSFNLLFYSVDLVKGILISHSSFLTILIPHLIHPLIITNKYIILVIKRVISKSYLMGNPQGKKT